MREPEEKTPEGILPLRTGWSRTRHVLKHLYRRAERWDLAVPALPPRLRERALRAGCSIIDRVQAGSEQPEPVCQECQRLVQSDHEAYYHPAYMRSIRTAGPLRRAGALGDAVGRRAYVGDNGVFVVSTDGSDGTPPRVVSAYRISLPDAERRQPAEFVRAAVRRWRDKTSLLQKDLP